MNANATPAQPKLRDFESLAKAARAPSVAAVAFRFLLPQALVEAARAEDQRRLVREALAALDLGACAAQAQARDIYTITIQDRPPEVRLSTPARPTNESWRRQGKRPGRRKP